MLRTKALLERETSTKRIYWRSQASRWRRRTGSSRTRDLRPAQEGS